MKASDKILWALVFAFQATALGITLYGVWTHP